MSLGLLVLVASVPCIWAMYRAVVSQEDNYEAVIQNTLQTGAFGGVAGLGLGVTLLWVSKVIYPLPLSTFEAALGGASFTSASSIIYLLSPNLIARHSRKISLGAIVLIMHAAGFASNSFVMWEDRIVLYLFMTLLVPLTLSGINAPTAHLRKRILGFGALAAICVRLMASSTVCREEQQPYCHVTFYASAGASAAPIWALLLAFPAAWFLPTAVRRVLAISGSDNGIAPSFATLVVRPALLGSALWWTLERLEGTDILGGESIAPAIRALRTLIARTVLLGVATGGSVLWYTSGPCIAVQRRTDETGKPVLAVLGFANAYGSSYLLFFLLAFSLTHAVSQLTAQLVLGLSLVALLAYLEVLDSTRDARSLRDDSVAALCLLGNIAFFATGHQAVLSTIQWKSAFVGFPTLTYPFSPALVGLNTFGGFILSALAVPLLALWNVDPSPGSEDRAVRDTLRVALGVVLYRSVELVWSAITAAWLRRHLMVWKVFAPRFMLGGVVVLLTDVFIILGVWLGAGQALLKVQRTFKKEA
ncbi:GPI ethanolamine phosphate transferase [Rhizoctonia solani AG-3 Rhs1AP]|uniref:GPI ethanolamine phosphate transferase n=1 Tax=Rhizoctonia solani AG-3 Rhs1AP TaxID=1086054 RepID=X8JJZ5_9AGAM|nr:GPI ethanolamine phosphate transferase [Rhizoctonia solani AG-3 Rhs1AP]